MLQKLEPKVIEQAIAMRRTGAIYTDIAEELNISLGSVGNIMKGIQFTEEEHALIKDVHHIIRSEAHKLRVKPAKERKSQAKHTPEKRKEIKTSQLNAIRLKYTDSELKIKPLLEKQFDCAFTKEVVDTAVVPFASEQYLVLVSRSIYLDHHLVKQFAIIASTGDKRKRFAYVMNMDGLAAQRLGNVRFRITVLPTSELLESI